MDLLDLLRRPEGKSLERVGRMDLDPKDRTIVQALESGEGRLPSNLAELIGLTPRATRTRLARLVELGLVRSVGTGPRDPRRRYYRGG
jgi:DNA-binding transcriptional ArsR family regulator